MRINVGHVVFSSMCSLLQNADGGVSKRMKYEDSLGVGFSNVGAVCSAVVASVREALQRSGNVSGNADVFVDVCVHEEMKGVSFCFVPNYLNLSASTPVGTGIFIPAGLSIGEIQRAEKLPCFSQLRLRSAEGVNDVELPVYWEKRLVLLKQETQLVAVSAELRDVDCEALLTKRVLVVGAGGIGCELLKVLILHGFTNVDVFDLDTIDATNLNRQFLFNKNDVGQSKSATASSTVMSWFTPSTPRRPPNICAHHANIKDDTYDKAFFQQFAVVLNALDNVSARQHVNRMCKQAGVPLVESGTMGYNGQVQPIIYGRYECYDCHPKVSGKQTLAVCTVHARPTTMVHCVHYAKELYERLFGDAQRDAGDELAFVDDLLTQERGCKGTTDTDGRLNLAKMAVTLGRCLFISKIEELLAIKAAWPTRPPVPLQTLVLENAGEGVIASRSDSKSVASGVVRDSLLTLEETALLFVDAFVRCASRSIHVAFRKEDDDTVDFVAAVSNLRALIFHISPQQSVEEIRSIAGSIVPAIATTNAIIAAGVVQQALRVLLASDDAHKSVEAKMIYVRRVPQVRRRRFSDKLSIASNGNSVSGPTRWVSDMYLVHSVPPNPASDKCLVCRDRHPTVNVYLNANEVTIGDFICRVLQERLNMYESTIFHGASILYEKDDYEALISARLSTQMKADLRPLDILVDDLHHDLEWRVVIHHRDGADKETSQSEIVVEGLEAALDFERSLLTVAGDDAAADVNDIGGVAVNDASNADEETRLPQRGSVSDAAVVVVIDSDDESSDEVCEVL